jgi:hypothetical protein
MSRLSHINPILLLVFGLAGSLLRVALGLVKRNDATITSDVTQVPLTDAGAGDGGRETQFCVVGVNTGQRPVDTLKLAIRRGKDSELLLPSATLLPVTSGMMPRVREAADGLECEVFGLAPGQSLSVSFVLRSRYQSDVDFEWSSPSGRVTVVSPGPPAASPRGRFGQLAGIGLAGYLVMQYVPRFAQTALAGDLQRAVVAGSWAVAAGCFAWVGFGLYDLLQTALRPNRGS